MMFKLEIDMENEAFVDYPATELCLLLDATKRQVMAQRDDLTEGRGHVFDTNGNRVGRWGIDDA